jgi:acyl-CoA thioester hydrolase
MVHFSVFFRYMEEAEHAVWRAAGMDIFASRETHSWPRISAQFDFKHTLNFQDEFEVRTEIARVTRSTIRWAHLLMRGDVIIGSGSVTAVYVKKLPGGGIKSTEIAADIVPKLQEVLRED